MNWEKSKNFIIGGGAAVLMVVFLFAMDWRVQVHVAAQFKSVAAEDPGISTNAKIIAMDTERQANTLGVANNKEDISDTDERLAAVAAILMRAPESQ